MGELIGILGEEHPQCGLVVTISCHCVTEHHSGALGVQFPIGVAEVHQRLPGRSDRPFLGEVHRIADPRRNREAPFKRRPFPIAYPSTDLRVRLVLGLAVLVEVEVGIPPIRIDLSDAVAAIDQVLPVGGDVRGVGQDCTDADDGDCSPSLLNHSHPLVVSW